MNDYEPVLMVMELSDTRAVIWLFLFFFGHFKLSGVPVSFDSETKKDNSSEQLAIQHMVIRP